MVSSPVRTAATALLLALAAVPAAAQGFYQGKQIKVLVGYPPGGGSDLYGRVIADGLGRHVEGKPFVVVQNQPGAGSVIAMNNYTNRVPRDGTTVLIGTGQLLVRLLLGLDARTVSSFFRVYRASVLREASRRYGDKLITETGFACKAELLAKIASLGTRIEEVPVDLDGSRRVGESKMSIGPTLAGYWRLFRGGSKLPEETDTTKVPAA